MSDTMDDRFYYNHDRDWSDDEGSVGSFYGIHRTPASAMNPEVKWTAPINDLYGRHYRVVRGRNKKK